MAGIPPGALPPEALAPGAPPRADVERAPAAPRGGAPEEAPGPERIGLRIVGLRRQRQMTQAELARAAGLRQSSLSDVEAGGNARADTLFAIARALGVSVSTLYGERVEAIAPADADFYRDFRELAPAARDEIRRYVFVRWTLQEDPDVERLLEARREARLARHMALREVVDAQVTAVRDEVTADAYRQGFEVLEPTEDGTGVRRVPDPRRRRRPKSDG